MEPAGDHDVPSGPLAVRWLAYELPGIRAGALAEPRVALENAGTATWIPTGPRRVCLGYHWLDELGNPIIWDGLWTALPHDVPPGGRTEATLTLRGPIPPGRYRLAIDLVAEDRYWFTEVGNASLEREVHVEPRLRRRALAVRDADPGALDALEEPVVGEDDAEAIAYLAPEVVPKPDWSRRVLDAHEEGFAVVGGSIDTSGGLLHRLRIGHVGGNGVGPPADRLDLLGCRVKAVVAAGEEPDGVTPGPERPGDRPAHTGAGARHHHDP